MTGRAGDSMTSVVPVAARPARCRSFAGNTRGVSPAYVRHHVGGRTDVAAMQATDAAFPLQTYDVRGAVRRAVTGRMRLWPVSRRCGYGLVTARSR